MTSLLSTTWLPASAITWRCSAGSSGSGRSAASRRARQAATPANTNNGVRDAGETGIANVPVTLTGRDINGATVNRSTVTDASGNWRFDDLPAAGAGGYTVTEQTPQPVVGGATTLNGRTVAGSSGGGATAVGSTPSAVSAIALAAGPIYDLCERAAADLLNPAAYLTAVQG